MSSTSRPTATGPAAAATRPRVALTIGKLDGVHAGHRHLLAHVIEAADRRGVASAAVVLNPDPATVLAGQRVPLLTTVEERQRRMAAFGIDHVRTLAFDRALANLSPSAFVDRLIGAFDLATVVIGPDFVFGHRRAGTPEVLAALGADRGFDVVVAEPLVTGGRKVGSRAIRAHIAAGDIATAAALLRAPPRLVGSVVPGAARGRTLGFPTANLALTADYELPADGVYTVAATWRGATGRASGPGAYGLASIGLRPTFGAGARLVEVHLLDFAGDLYGAEMTVDFLLHQRGELYFDSPEALIRQMTADAAAARAFLARETAPPWTSQAGPDRDDLVLTAHGGDLATACGHLAGAWRAAAGGAADTAPPPSRRRLTLTAATDAQLTQAWLDYLTAYRPSAADVYHAADGQLHALVRDGGRATLAGPLRAVAELGRAPDADLTLTATITPARV